MRIGVTGSFSELVGLVSNLEDKWIFRGQSNGAWDLATSIERQIRNFELSERESRVGELNCLRQFQRRAHHYLDHLPEEEDLVEWLSLIQHHGGPTRMLDFSYSFYVAAYFACNSLSDNAAIWGVNLTKLLKQVGERTYAEGDWNELGGGRLSQALNHYTNSQILAESVDSSIVVVEPEWMSERLSIQQGLFVVPTRVDLPFMSVLKAFFEIENDFHDPQWFSYSSDELVSQSCNASAVIKFEMSRSFQESAMDALLKMNISEATLFPGLDGFTSSLRWNMRRDTLFREFKRTRSKDNIEPLPDPQKVLKRKKQ